MRRETIFSSGSDECAAWFYLPESGGEDVRKPPVVVMAHGLGAVKEMRLDAFAERFAAAGYACLVFDYRHFGASSGAPRQLLSIGRQLADWRAALAWVRACDEVDRSRIVLWGTSFSGGLVLQVAAEDDNITAVIAQCPFTDGFASARAGHPLSIVKVGALALVDLAAAALGRSPVLVASAGPPGSTSLMNASGCQSGYLALVKKAPTFQNAVAARFGLAITRYVPGRQVRNVRAPILFAICDGDEVAPATTTHRHALGALDGEIRSYPIGHFDIYVGVPFELAVADYIDFLHRRVPL